MILWFSYSRLSNNEGCFRPQGGKDACHLHCNITCTHNHAASVRKIKLLIKSTNFTGGINMTQMIRQAYFGRVSSSKKPSLVMPRLAPEMIRKHNILHHVVISDLTKHNVLQHVFTKEVVCSLKKSFKTSWVPTRKCFALCKVHQR